MSSNICFQVLGGNGRIDQKISYVILYKKIYDKITGFISVFLYMSLVDTYRSEMMKLDNILTVKELVNRSKIFSEATLRWWVFNAESNGLKCALLKVGGRVYIDLDQFEQWLEMHRMG